MPRDARFWRNVALIAIAHLAVLLALARGGRDTRNSNLPNIVWMNSAAAEAVASTPPPPAAKIEAPSPKLEKQEEPAVPTLAKSEIQLPSPTPMATPTPKPTPKPTAAPTASPKPSPKASAKPTPKATPKKTIAATATPKPSPKNEKTAEAKEKSNDAKKETSARKDSTADKSTGDGPGNSSGQVSEFAWYRSMLHDRFHKEWEQPRTIVASGAKMSTLVKIRIEKDGRVSKFTITKASGNIVVDESVAAVAKKVTRVDPLPSGLSSKDYYEVSINFELNPEQ
jgi:TonB family protein